jgi:phytoene dehydrogenase-like protein
MAAAPDAIVIGAGPNGLSAAVALARAGRSVTVYEALDTIGGGASSAELTLPGFVHDVCSAVHPFAVASPFWRTLPLAEHGLRWVHAAAELAHPLDGGDAAIAWHFLDVTASHFGKDAAAYLSLFEPIVDDWKRLLPVVLGKPAIPAHPFAVAKFGIQALAPAWVRARRSFVTERPRALLAGMAAHAMLPLERFPTGAVALVFTALAHTTGWPFPEGGAQRLSDALASLLRSLGGTIVTGARVENVDDLPRARAILCDLSPRPLLRIAGHRFPAGFRDRLAQYRYGVGVFKVDWALDAPIPWSDPRVSQAGTVHVGGTLDEVAAAERDVAKGRLTDRPFVLLSQPTLFDPTRAPAGRHIAWGYCHVPNGSNADMLPRIEAQIERFAPGFRDRILARRVTTTSDLERRNPNLVGGDIGMGVMDWRQLFTRPTWRLYTTPAPDIYLCSASTPPGVGVHGMCGYFAAQAALKGALR